MGPFRWPGKWLNDNSGSISATGILLGLFAVILKTDSRLDSMERKIETVASVVAEVKSISSKVRSPAHPFRPGSSDEPCHPPFIPLTSSRLARAPVSVAGDNRLYLAPLRVVFFLVGAIWLHVDQDTAITELMVAGVMRTIRRAAAMWWWRRRQKGRRRQQ